MLPNLARNCNNSKVRALVYSKCNQNSSQLKALGHLLHLGKSGIPHLLPRHYGHGHSLTCSNNVISKTLEMCPLSMFKSKENLFRKNRSNTNLPMQLKSFSVAHSCCAQKINAEPSESSTSSRMKNSYNVTNKVQQDLDEWETVYRFNHIKLARVIQRLKIYQTGLTCGLVLPLSVGCFLYGTVSAEALNYSLGSSVLASVMFYVMGTFCSRLIGIIYVSRKDNTLVKVAHLNFWGKREDQVLAKTDFIPFSELEDNLSDIYVNLRFYSEPENKLHICLRYGTVYNRREFIEIFGTHAQFEIREKKPESQKNKEE